MEAWSEQDEEVNGDKDNGQQQRARAKVRGEGAGDQRKRADL